METCANIQLMFLLLPSPSVAFCHFTNSSAKILVILILDVVVLFMVNRNMHIAFLERERESARCTHWFRVCCRRSKTVNFDSIFECENLAEASKFPAELHFDCIASIWFRFDVTNERINQECRRWRRRRWRQSRQQSATSYDIIKAWSCLECQQKLNSNIVGLRRQHLPSSYPCGVHKFRLPFTLFYANTYRWTFDSNSKHRLQKPEERLCCGCRFIARLAKMDFG